MTRLCVLALAPLAGCGLWIDGSEIPGATPVDSGTDGDSADEPCPVLVDRHPTSGYFWRRQSLQLLWDRPVAPGDVSFEVTTFIGDNTPVSLTALAAGGRAHIYEPTGRGWPTPVSESGWLEHVTADVSWGCGSTTLEFDVSADGDFAAEPVKENDVVEAVLSTSVKVGPLSTRFDGSRLNSTFVLQFTSYWLPGTPLQSIYTTTTQQPGALNACSPRRVTSSAEIDEDRAEIFFRTRDHIIELERNPVRVDSFQAFLAMSFGDTHRVGRGVLSVPIEDLGWAASDASDLDEVRADVCTTEWCGPCLNMQGDCIRLLLEDMPLMPSEIEPFTPYDPCVTGDDSCDFCALSGE